MPEYLTAREYAERFKVAQKTVRRYIKAGVLSTIRLGEGGPRSPVRIVVEGDRKGEPK